MEEKDFREVVSSIMTIVQKCSEPGYLKKLDGNQLSYTATKLAALKGYLLETKVDAHKAFLEAEAEYKATKSRAMRRIVGQPIKEGGAKISQSAAEGLIYDEEDVLEASKAKTEAEVFWNKLKNLTSDTHDLIDSIKSRVIDMQGARRDER